MLFKDKRINCSIFGVLGVFCLFWSGFLVFNNKKLLNMGLEKYAVCSVTGKYQGLCRDCLD